MCVGGGWGVLCFLPTLANFWGLQLKLVTSFEPPATVVAVYPVQHRNQPAFVQRLCSSVSHIINIKGSVELCILLCSCWCLITETHTAWRGPQGFSGGHFGMGVDQHQHPGNFERPYFSPKTEFQLIPWYSVFNNGFLSLDNSMIPPAIQHNCN